MAGHTGGMIKVKSREDGEVDGHLASYDVLLN
jgi:hypothetical protein